MQGVFFLNYVTKFISYCFQTDILDVFAYERKKKQKILIYINIDLLQRILGSVLLHCANIIDFLTKQEFHIFKTIASGSLRVLQGNV